MDALDKTKLLKKVRLALETHAVLVEGKKDVKAIEQAGFEKVEATPVSSNNPQKIADKVAQEGKPVVLLFDFDSEGKRKASEFERLLVERGVAVNRNARKAFRALFGVRTVEDLPTAVERLTTEVEKNG